MTPPFQLTSTPLRPGITLLEASAGTGKTYTIAALVLRLVVEQRLSIGEILVVTFTEAATAELRGRIRERLAHARQTLRAGTSSDPVWAELLLRGSAEDRSERLALVEAALEQFDDAAVFTIHGFCHRVLQERAFESRALFDARLEPDVTSFQREAADNFWRRHFYEAPARHVGFAHHAGVTADSLFELLRTHARQARVTTLARATDRSLAAVMAEADVLFAEAGQIWRTQRATIAAMFGDAGGEWAKQPYNRDDLMAPLLAALDAVFDEAGMAADQVDALLPFRQSALHEAKHGRKKHLSVPTHPFFVVCDHFAEALDFFGARLRYEFLQTAPTELIRLKDRDRSYGFDDLLLRVADALAGPSGPSLAVNLRRRYRAALIDEFQDTDPVQWSIFERVFCDVASQLYLVGDPKQAIYSFRGADVFAYLRARGRADREFTLGENWRSEPGLVTAVNRLWSLNPRPFALTEISFPPVSSRGAAKDTPLQEAGKMRPPLRIWFWDAPSEGATNQPRQHARLAEAVADEIVRLLTDDVRLGSRRVAPGDLAVLVDSHAQAEQVAAALARRRVPSVQRTQQSVFATRAAAEMQSLLEALAGGARDGQRRAALATSLLGLDAVTLDALRREDAGWETWLDRLAQWSDQWERNGFLPMLETVLRDQGTRARLLRRPDGERQLTNFLHLGELLQQAAVTERRSPRALTLWLAEQRGRADGGEEATKESLLRLERDAAAVQLVTIHSSKGLEYPIVFCPFLTRKPDPRNETVLFHDPTDAQALKHDVGSEQQEEHRAFAVGEAFAENLRLLYVALTRAKHRCYVGWGLLNGSEKAALAWLFHSPVGAGTLALEELVPTLEEHVGSLAPGLRREQINALAGAEIQVDALPAPTAETWIPPAITETLSAPRVFHGKIRRDWGMTSFSALAHGLADEAPDRDAVEVPGGGIAAEPEALSDPLATFRGTRAGTCLHEVFEQLDFATVTEPEIRALVDDCLRAHGFASEELGGPLSALVGRVLDVELVPGGSLRHVPAAACWRELEFLLPLNQVTPAALRAAFAVVPRGMPWDDLTVSLGRLGFADIEGFLSGFIDLVFRHDGRWWLVDWKSNWLGESPDAYGPEALWREMLGQLYPLQYHLYLLALHRLLRTRLPDYVYERDVGGVRYVFVRGVTPGRPELGIFGDRPPLAVIEQLERRLLGGPPGAKPT